MTGLSTWLKQIVAVVLLAGLVDLLLPNRTMQRYVRLIAGLFILLAVAGPILKWIQGDFGSKLAEELGGLELRPASASASGELARIEAEGRKWKETQQKQAARLVEARLEEAIRADVESSERRKVEEVRVALDQAADGTLAVREVTVALAAAEAEGKPDRTAPVEPVKPVAPVAAVGAGDARPAAAEPAGEALDRQTQLRVSAFVAARYGVPPDRVQITAVGSNEGNGR